MPGLSAGPTRCADEDCYAMIAAGYDSAEVIAMADGDASIRLSQEVINAPFLANEAKVDSRHMASVVAGSGANTAHVRVNAEQGETY